MRMPWHKKDDGAIVKDSVAPVVPAEPSAVWARASASPSATVPLLDVDAAARTAAHDAVRELMPAQVERAVSSAISPLMAAQASLAQSPYGIYGFDHPIHYSTPQTPQRRPGSMVTVGMLRQLAETYDILRSCIQHLKREVMSVPIQIVPRDPKRAEALAEAIADAEAFFSRGGGLGGFNRKRSRFEGAILEDLMIVGAAAIFYHPRRSGSPYTAVEVDAATIRPRTDAYGWPGPGECQYEQWIDGVLVSGFTANQLDYIGLAENERSYTPYPASSVEWLIHKINAALRVGQWNLSFLTDGTTPGDVMALPESWTPQQIKDWQAHWTAMLAGNTEARQQTKFVPSGTQCVGALGRKDQDFSDFDLWLLRCTCSVMGVSPASIGFAGEQYKVSQDGAMDGTTAFGAGVLLAWRKELYDDILERLGHGDLEVQNVNTREEKATERAARNKDLIGTPIKTINEGRQDEGLDAVEGGDQILVPNTFMPLTAALKATAPGTTPPPDDDDTDPDAPDSPADDTSDGDASDSEDASGSGGASETGDANGSSSSNDDGGKQR